jgi:hypothetical protein
MAERSFSLRELFDVAVDLPPAERGAVLDALCPDREKRERLERMLSLGADQLDLRQRYADNLADAIGPVDEASPFDTGQRIGDTSRSRLTLLDWSWACKVPNLYVRAAYALHRSTTKQCMSNLALPTT